MKKKEAKVKSTMELAKAINYLEDIVKSLKAGTVSVINGDETLTMSPEPSVKVTLSASQKSDKESLSLKVSWRKPEVEEGEQDGDHELRIVGEKAEDKSKAQPA